MNFDMDAASIAVRTYTEKNEQGEVTGVKHFTVTAISESGVAVTIRVPPQMMQEAFEELIDARVNTITSQAGKAIEAFVKDTDAIIANVGDAASRLTKSLRSDLHVRKPRKESPEPGPQ